jgi:hypothetical protein
LREAKRPHWTKERSALILADFRISNDDLVSVMVKPAGNANRNLETVIALCSEMLELADLGDHYRADDGCGVVFGWLRDSAYKIRRLAKDELARHGGCSGLPTGS